jgi:hypothetical protein
MAYGFVVSLEYGFLFSRVFWHLGMRGVCGAPIPERRFQEIIDQHSLADWLEVIGRLSAAIQPPVQEGAADLDLATHLGRLASATAEKIAAGGRFVTSQTLNTLAREALLRAPDTESRGFDERSISDVPNALLAVVDLFEERRPDRIEAGSVDDFVTSMLLRRFVIPAHLRNTLPRIYRLFITLPKEKPELAAQYDFNKRSIELTGLALGRYLAICLSFFTRFSQLPPTSPERWMLDHTYYAGKSSILRDEFTQAIRTVSATVGELRLDYHREVAEGRRGLDDHRPIVRRPLCEVRTGAFVPIDHAALGERMVGDGIYWRMRPTHEQEKSRYGATVGALLEEHLYEVARDIYPLRTPPNAERLYREKSYASGDGRVHSFDLAIFDTMALVVLEIGATFVNVRDTIERGMLDALDADIEAVLLPRVEQLDRKIHDLRTGTLTYGHALQTDALIYPVVCLFDGFPFVPGIRSRIDMAINQKGYLKMENLGRLSIISAEEFEVACAIVEQRRMEMSELLAKYSSDSDLRDYPLSEFIRERQHGLPITSFLAREFERATNEMAAQIGSVKR